VLPVRFVAWKSQWVAAPQLMMRKPESPASTETDKPASVSLHAIEKCEILEAMVRPPPANLGDLRGLERTGAASGLPDAFAGTMDGQPFLQIAQLPYDIPERVPLQRDRATGVAHGRAEFRPCGGINANRENVQMRDPNPLGGDPRCLRAANQSRTTKSAALHALANLRVRIIDLEASEGSGRYRGEEDCYELLRFSSSKLVDAHRLAEQTAAT